MDTNKKNVEDQNANPPSNKNSHVRPIEEIIREPQGDLGDRAEIEIENTIQAEIDRIRSQLPRP